MNREWLVMSRAAVLTGGLCAIAVSATACSSEERSSGGGTGGTAGAGGGTGRGDGGHSACACIGSGGAASGGARTGGDGGDGGRGTGGVPVETGPDAGCVSPRSLVYRSPGCTGTESAECLAPLTGAVDGGLTEACACDGSRILAGNNRFGKPYRHLGECTDTDVERDAGHDAGNDAH
jgi:hypothetical protein